MTRNKAVLAAVTVGFCIALVGCGENEEAVTLQSFGEHIISAMGADYDEAMNELGIDGSKVALEDVTNDLKNGEAEESINIMDHSYRPYIFTDQDKLTAILLRTEIDDAADALQSIQSLLDEMNSLYGTPSTYPLMSGRLIDYVENPETAPTHMDGYAETWAIKDKVIADADIVLEAKLSLLTPIEDDPNRLNYGIEINYQYKYTGYRPAS